MDDATQKLVDEARAEAERRYFIPDSLRRTQIERFVDGARFGFEAAQRRAEEDHAEANRLVNEYAVKAGNLALALEAAQRPSVGPEVREAVRAVVGEQLTKAGLDLNGPPYSDDGETQWPLALELRDRLTAALLARFSVPSQPVYDEKRVSDIIRDGMIYERLGGPGGENGYERSVRTAAALVAALRGGELTREGTNEGSTT